MPGGKSKEKIEDDLVVRWRKKVFEDGDRALCADSINRCGPMCSKTTHLEEILKVPRS